MTDQRRRQVRAARVLVPAAFLLLAAACSGSHPAAKLPPGPAPTPTPIINTAALHAYAETMDGVSTRLDLITKGLQGCDTPSGRCTRYVADSGALARSLLRQLRFDDALRESGPTEPIAPGISPIVVMTESDARRVKRSVESMANDSTAIASPVLTKQVRRLMAEVNEWQPGGRAANDLAAVHVTVPTVASR